MAYLDTQGTTIAVGDGAEPEVFTDISQVTSIDPVGFTRGLNDVTNLSSTAREYRPQIKDGQEINLEIQFDPDDATHNSLRTDLNNGTARNFEITLTDDTPTVITFTALVTAWSLGFPIDGVVPLRVTLKPTGDLVFAEES